MKMLFVMLSMIVAITVHAAHATGPAPVIVLQTNVKVERFLGYAYDLDTNKYLYTEVRVERVQENRWLGGTVTYFAPNGTEVGKIVLDFSKDPYLPLYRMDVKNVHYSEGISKITADKVYVFKQNAGDASPQQASVKRKNDMAAGWGFINLIKAHFAQLLAGKPLHFPLVEAGKLDYRNFTISRLKDGSFEGRKTVRFKVERDSLLRLIAGKPLILAFDPKTRKALEYRGVSDLRDPKTNKPYQVRVDYYSKPPADAPKHLPPLDPDQH